MALWEAVHGRYGPLNMEIKYHAFRKYEASLRKIEHKGAKASDARIMKCIKKFAFFCWFYDSLEVIRISVHNDGLGRREWCPFRCLIFRANVDVTDFFGFFI